MVKHIKLVLNGVKDTCCFVDAAELAEQADKLGLKQVLVVEAVLDDEGKDLVELCDGGAEL